MLSTKQVKEYAKKCGADLVGIGSMDRFEGAPKEMDPRYIFPDAKVIIGLAFRIPRGYLRGIEEGTHFFQYPSLGYANINEVYAPIVVREVCRFLEDNGYEGVGYRNTGGRGSVSDMDGRERGPSPEEHQGRVIPFSEPVSPDKPPPDVFFHFRIAAFICGLGEIGWSKVFLTPEFGPRQRFAFVLTDAPLEPDPIYEGPPLCDRCMSCVRECPVHAISATESVKVKVTGRELEWGKLNVWACMYGYCGGVKEINPFLPRDAFKDIPDGDKIMSGEKILSTWEEAMKIREIIEKFYPLEPVCGGRGCIRACMVHLEKQGKLKNKFKEPFRKRKPWKL